MTQHFPLNYEDPVHQGFFDAIQELLGASVPNLRIVVSSATQLSIVATSGNGQNSVAIQGLYRWVTSTVTAALPGGLSNGVGNVWVTGSANDFGGDPSNPDAATVYTFGLEIRASGTPSTAVSRKVGEVDVVSSAIVAYRQTVGSRPTGDMTLSATPDTATQPGLLIRAVSGQSANLIQVKNNAGSTIWSVSPTGEITTSDVNLTGTVNVTGASTGQVLVATGTEFAPALITNSSVQTGTLALSKLASGTSAQIIVGDGSGVPTYRTVTGDVTVSSEGVTTIGATKVTNGMLAGSIAYSKLNLSGAVTNADLAGSIAYSKLVLTGAVTNADLAGSIAYSKLVLTGAVTTTDLKDLAVTDAKVAAANKDGAAGTPSLRTLGTGASQAAAGNDSRLSNSRTPSGTAGGALTGSYPNPTLAKRTQAAWFLMDVAAGSQVVTWSTAFPAFALGFPSYAVSLNFMTTTDPGGSAKLYVSAWSPTAITVVWSVLSVAASSHINVIAHEI